MPEATITTGGVSQPAGTNTALHGAHVLANTFATASTTVAAPSGTVTNIINQTASTLNVASSTGFNSSGGEFTVIHRGTPYLVSYTGAGSGVLTGCTLPSSQIVFTTGDVVQGGNGTGTGTNATALQLVDIGRDYMLYLNCTTTGTATAIAIGPTSAVAVPIVASAAATAGVSLDSIKIPAGWYVKITATTTVFTATAISD